MQLKLVLACSLIALLANFISVNSETLELNNCRIASIRADLSNNSYNFIINSSIISKNILFYIPIYSNDTPALLAVKEAQFNLLSDAYFNGKSVTIDGNIGSGKFEIRRVSIGNFSTEAPLACNSALTKCVNDCVDLRTDAKNCGTCGHICPAGKACRNGACAG